MRNLTELNINEGGRLVSRIPPSDLQIRDFERQYNVKLPFLYLSLLSYANGGHPQLDSIEVTSTVGKSRWSVNYFFYLNDDKDGTMSLWYAMNTWCKIIGKGSLPIANDGGGNVFFIDNTTDAVKVCIHDTKFALRDIASSLEEFIDRLSVDPDFI